MLNGVKCKELEGLAVTVCYETLQECAKTEGNEMYAAM